MKPQPMVVVEDVEVLDPGSHEVLVRWAANGVCHSDLHVVTGDYPHPLPVVLGHEAAGVVERVGAAVETVKVGDHVCSSYIPSCGRCRYCIGGQPTLCALRDRPRWFMLDGTSRFAPASGEEETGRALVDEPVDVKLQRVEVEVFVVLEGREGQRA